MYEDKNATYALNSYVWKLLETNLSWTTHQGAKPIIPLSQQPEFMQTGKPFLVYGSARHPSEHNYALVKESVSYTICAKTATEVNKIAGLLADAFARQDIAAADVNDWLLTEQTGTGVSRGISFGSVRTIMVETAEPSDQEGGYILGLVMLEANYTEVNNTIVTSGFTYTP